MATSSIFANFDISDRKKALAFAKALEESEKDASAHGGERAGRILRTPKEIGSFFGIDKTKRICK